MRQRRRAREFILKLEPGQIIECRVGTGWNFQQRWGSEKSISGFLIQTDGVGHPRIHGFE